MKMKCNEMKNEVNTAAKPTVVFACIVNESYMSEISMVLIKVDPLRPLKELE